MRPAGFIMMAKLLLSVDLVILKSMINDEKVETIKHWLGTGSINIFGLPLSGKDTQCKILATILGGNIFGGGAIIRDKKNEAPESIASYTRAGLLPPSGDFLNFTLPHLKNPSLDGKPILLSSFGRWLGEEKTVLGALSESNHPLRAVLYLYISTNESEKRMQALETDNDRSERFDDTGSKLNKRFDEFNEKTLPVIEFYRSQGLLIEIDGSGTREEVTNLIIDALYNQALA